MSSGLRTALAGVLTVAVVLWLIAGRESSETGIGDNGVLRIGIYSLPPALGSPLRSLGPPSIFFVSAIFDTLVEVAPGGVPTPSLALSWERVEPERWIFHLRPDVAFSNGEAMNASAVVSSFRRIIDLAQPTVLSSLVANVAAIDAVDDMTVAITTRRPTATLPNDISGIWIVPPLAWQATGDAAFARAPIGTGPFIVAAWTESRVDMVANPASWRPPKVQRLTFTQIAEEAARLAALGSGSIDIAIQASPDAIDTITAAGGRILAIPGGTVYTVALNAERTGSPFADRRVRQAVNFAVDKEAIARVLYRGTAHPVGQPASPITAGHDPGVKPYPYDPARARALLAEAGYGEGFDLLIEMVTNAIPADAAAYSAVARDLAAVGIRAEVHAVPLPVFFARLFDNSLEGLAFQLGFISMPNLDTVKGMADYSCDKPGSKPFICVPAVQDLVDRARAELDPSARLALLREINRVAHDEALALYLVDAVDLVAVGPRVVGDSPATRFYHWENFSLRN